MQIREMFAKPIDRDLQGVIIVGQDEDCQCQAGVRRIRCHKGIAEAFCRFFASYKTGIIGNTSKTGVWISGFFGSGKSHFLKSYLTFWRIKRLQARKQSTILWTIIK